jgi:hypothetical protein
MKKNLLFVLFFVLLINCVEAYGGEYTDSCARYAKKLSYAADEFDSAKSNYESSCDPYYGFMKDDESACGPFGYERSSLESAASELEYALDKVNRYCGV